MEKKLKERTKYLKQIMVSNKREIIVDNASKSNIDMMKLWGRLYCFLSQKKNLCKRVCLSVDKYQQEVGAGRE